MNELKPCPFCGGKAVLFVDKGVKVLCQKCGASSVCWVDTYSDGKPHGIAVQRVIERWNNRIEVTDDESH